MNEASGREWMSDWVTNWSARTTQWQWSHEERWAIMHWISKQLSRIYSTVVAFTVEYCIRQSIYLKAWSVVTNSDCDLAVQNGKQWAETAGNQPWQSHVSKSRRWTGGQRVSAANGNDLKSTSTTTVWAHFLGKVRRCELDTCCYWSVREGERFMKVSTSVKRTRQDLTGILKSSETTPHPVKMLSGQDSGLTEDVWVKTNYLMSLWQTLKS